MSNLQSYENINEFAESLTGTDTIIEELSNLSEQEKEDLDTSLAFVDDQDPIAEWGNEIRRGESTRAFAEIVLTWHFRRVIGRDAVTLNAEYTDTGKDFDLMVNWENQEYWIDVRTPEGALGEIRGTGGGFIAGDSVGASITNKLEKQFKTAQKALPDDVILVLAVYLQATALDQLLIGKHLHEINQEENIENPGLYCDAFLEYAHHHGQTTIDVREFTDQGKQVTELRDELLEDG